MDKYRRAEINHIAAKVRHDLGYDDEQVIAPEALVKKLGGKIEFFDPGEHDAEALITVKDGQFKILLERDSYIQRQNFSIGHELGHLFLHMNYSKDKNNKIKSNKEKKFVDITMKRLGYSELEFEAHEFSGALLMPKSAFKSLVQENSKGGIVDVTPIAKHFNVSLEAVKYRGRWLGFFSWE